MEEDEKTRLRAIPNNGLWKIWGANQIAIVVLLAVAAVITATPGRGPFLRGEDLVDKGMDVALPAIATAQVLSGVFVYLRNVVRGPSAHGRAARNVRARLRVAESASDPDHFFADAVLLLDRNFVGVSILSWALGEGGAMLAGIYTLLRGFQPAGIAVVVLWLLSMVVSAPTAGRRDGYRRRLLRAAGLDDAAAEQLLALAAS